MSTIAKNPILSGFYPDPSICVKGYDYYIVNSSFAYFPGLPIMHSRDLAHWEQIGNVLDRESQLPLENAGHSQGLFAPTIRYNEKDGLFYVICTNVSHGGNFVVTAENPEGPWSEPHFIEGADGIDPSLMFDEDGKCYYIGTHENPDGCKYNGDYYIYIQEFDTKEFKLVGEQHNVWNGALKNCIWPEGPHLYHIGDYYYILHAEGGTGPEHAVCVARSKSVFGPFENNPCNPIFTHRHLGVRYPVKYVGHGDMFQTSEGEWYMVMLAVRPANGYTTMGRETFLAKVLFENDWPIVNPGVGILTEELLIDLDEEIPECEDTSRPNVDKYYDFRKMKELGPEWLSLRKPVNDLYKFSKDKGLMLKCSTDNLVERTTPSFLAIRQDSHMFECSASLFTDNLYMGAKAGLVLMQSNDFNIRFEITDCRGALIMCKEGKEEELARVVVNDSPATVRFVMLGTKMNVSCGRGKNLETVLDGVDVSYLSTEVAGGFVGNTIGIYATDGEDRPLPVFAEFASFDYRRLIVRRYRKEDIE